MAEKDKVLALIDDTARFILKGLNLYEGLRPEIQSGDVVVALCDCIITKTVMIPYSAARTEAMRATIDYLTTMAAELEKTPELRQIHAKWEESVAGD